MARLPIYVINLDRRPDRWHTISMHLERLGLEATRIPGIEAQTLADQEEWEIEHGDGPFWKINLGSAAGMLGHGKAMSLLLDSPHPAALILEDDAELASETPELLNTVEWWPSGSMVIRLEDGGTSPKPRSLWRPNGQTPNGRRLHRLERRLTGSAAYLINRAGARLVLEAFADPIHTVDQTLFDLRVSKTARRLQTVQIIPTMARQRLDPSDQTTWRQKVERTGWPRKRQRLKWRMQSIPYEVFVLALRAIGQIRKEPVFYKERL